MKGVNAIFFYIIYINIIIFTFLVVRIIQNAFFLNDNENQINSINVSEEVGSGPRDVVFFYATAFGNGLQLSISSLRKTGCKCRIILFISKTFEINRFLINFFVQNNVEVISNSDDSRQRGYAPHMLRYEFEYLWLLNHTDEVDRVLHSDAFDVFFQGDPFTRAIDNKSITFVIEPHQLRSCGWNIAWMNQCYGDIGVNMFRHNFIICSGSISGPSSEYLKFLEVLISQPEWSSCWGTSLDQPIVNYIVWSGKLTQNGIKYKFTGCDDGFFTMQWCVLDSNILYNEYNQIISTEGSVPSYIHQYNRYPELEARLKKRYCK